MDTDDAPTPHLRRAIGEAACFIAPALLVAIVVAAAYARQQSFIGSFDTEQIFYQALNLLNVFETGESVLKTSFLGVGTPYTYTPSLHAYTLPLLALSWLTNPWFAANLLVLVTLIANGASMYVLLRAAGMSAAAATLGGVIFFLSPTTVLRALVHPYLAQTWVLPVWFFVIYRDRIVGFRLAHWTSFGALIAVMFGLHEYLGVLGFALLALTLACSLGRLGWRRAAAASLLAVGVFVVLSAPVLWMYVAQRSFDRQHGVVFERTLGDSISLSAAPSDFLLPSNLNPVYRHVPALTREDRITEAFNYLGMLNLASLLLIAIWALWRRETLRDFLQASPLLRVLRVELTLTALGALIVSLGPRWKSHPAVLLPVTLLLAMHAPPFSMMRGWGRYGFVLYFVLTVLTAHVAAYLLSRWRRPWLGAVLLIAIACVDLTLLSSMPSFRVTVPSAVPIIADEPGDFFVLNLPMSSKGGALHAGVSQFLQWHHRKRIVTGYSAVDNPLYLDAVKASPLAALDFPDFKTAKKQDATAFGQWLIDTDIRFIIYEKKTQFYPHWFTPADDALLRGVTRGALQNLVTARFAEIIEDDEDYTVYRVIP